MSLLIFTAIIVVYYLATKHRIPYIDGSPTFNEIDEIIKEK